VLGDKIPHDRGRGLSIRLAGPQLVKAAIGQTPDTETPAVPTMPRRSFFFWFLIF